MIEKLVGNCYEFVTITMSRYSRCFVVTSTKWMWIWVTSANSNSKQTSNVQKKFIQNQNDLISANQFFFHVVPANLKISKHPTYPELTSKVQNFIPTKPQKCNFSSQKTKNHPISSPLPPYLCWTKLLRFHRPRWPWVDGTQIHTSW